MIHFNDGIHAKERSEAVPLTLEEENRVVYLINASISYSEFSDKEHDLLQRFIYNYENMCHFTAYSKTGKL